MERLTCPNCNIDVGREKLKRNNLHCPTCGFDFCESEDFQDREEKDQDLLDDEDELEEDKEEE